MRNAVVGVPALVLGMLVASVVRAGADPDDDAAARIERLNEAALRDVARDHFASARKKLYRAEGLGIGLWGVENRLRAQTYVELAALEIIERDDRDVAAGYFRQALRLWPRVEQTDPSLARDDVQRLFTQVSQAFHCDVPASCRGGQNPAEPDFPPGVAALDCRIPDAVMEGASFVVRCAAYPRLPMVSATLRYRPDGADQDTSVKMWGGTRGWWTGIVPGTSVAGKTMRLRVDGHDAAGEPIVVYGGEDNPWFTRIVPPAACACSEPVRDRCTLSSQ